MPKLESANEPQQGDAVFISGHTGYPKVSIILPARNEEKYIAKCLDSLINQSYHNFEIVVINDSSSDRTGEIIQRYHTLNSKVVVAINAASFDVNLQPISQSMQLKLLLILFFLFFLWWHRLCVNQI